MHTAIPTATSVQDLGPMNRLSDDMAYAFDGLARVSESASAAARPQAGLGDVLRQLDGPAASTHDLLSGTR
jgi:hypothetical protein